MKSQEVCTEKWEELSGKVRKDGDEGAVMCAQMTALLFLDGEMGALENDNPSSEPESKDDDKLALGEDSVEMEEDDGDDSQDDVDIDISVGESIGILTYGIYPKSDADLDQIIARLVEDRKTLPERSELGEPNWKMIDAQIAICEWAKGE